jgi:hypothetical protein
MTIEQLLSIWDSLSPYEQLILELLIIDEQSYATVSNITGVPANVLAQKVEKIKEKNGI